MKASQFERAIDRLDLPRSDVALLLGVDGSTIRRWVSGDREVSGTAVQLLKLVDAAGWSGVQALQKLGKNND